MKKTYQMTQREDRFESVQTVLPRLIAGRPDAS